MNYKIIYVCERCNYKTRMLRLNCVSCGIRWEEKENGDNTN